MSDQFDPKAAFEEMADLSNKLDNKQIPFWEARSTVQRAKELNAKLLAYLKSEREECVKEIEAAGGAESAPASAAQTT